MKKFYFLSFVIFFLLYAVSSSADKTSLKNTTALHQKFLLKDSVTVETCQEPFTVLTDTGQDIPAIVSTFDKEGNCQDHLIFDPNQLMGSVPYLSGEGGQYVQSQSSDLDLAAYWAPLWYQDVDDSDVRAEYITNFNYDGDWRGNNNWDNLNNFPLYGYIYYSVVETPTHWFIIYGDFHPRDWGPFPCFLGDCHENDLEGAQLVIRKNGTQYGELILVSTQAHDNLNAYSEHPDVSDGSKVISRNIPMDGPHVKLYVESEGHGVYVDQGVTGPDGPFGTGFNFPGGDGIIYRYTGVAEQPSGNNDFDVGYALLPLSDELWSRRLQPNQTFDRYFQYSGVRYSSGESIGGAFDGDNHEDDQAKPPWAWDDSSDGNVNKGDWAMDPAWAFSQHATIAHAYSLDYIDDFFLSPLGSVIAIDQNNASQYFTRRAMGPYGTNDNCEDNNYNKWCRESGINHWPQSMIGCYEIADDNGSSDCNYGNTNYIHYAWNKASYPYRWYQIDHIVVRTMTKQDVCDSFPGIENDDGWQYNQAGGWVLSLILSQSNGWFQQYCIDPPWPLGEHGPYRLTAWFDGDSLFDYIEVRAGDHKDEGAFEILGVDVALKPMCADGTLVGQCNASLQYCNEQLELEYNCQECGYTCPVGYSCTETGECRRNTGGCFLAGTPITMADGTKKPIERIKVGDIVLAYDEKTKQMKPDKVTEIFSHPKEDTYLIINGHLRVTPIHPVLSKGAWRRIGELKVGDTLTNPLGRDVPITDIQTVKEEVDVYNFEVNPHHTYVANGYIVHNRKLPELEQNQQETIIPWFNWEPFVP